VMRGPLPMQPTPFPRPPIPPSLNLPPIRPLPSAAPPPTFSFNQNRLPTTSSTSQTTATYEHPKVVYAAPPVINKPVTESQKTSTVSDTVTSTTVAAAKLNENMSPSVNAAVTSVAAIAASQHVASGIELNIPVEKIEAEKKSVVTVSQPPSAAPAPAETREQPSSTQSSAKKEKKEKKRKFVRMAAGTVWEDQTLGEWDLGEWFSLFAEHV